MTPQQKPDAFDQMVKAHTCLDDGSRIHIVHAAELLRQYHDRVVRLVTRQARCGLGQESIGDFILIHPLLDALYQLKKGT